MEDFRKEVACGANGTAVRQRMTHKNQQRFRRKQVGSAVRVVSRVLLGWHRAKKVYTPRGGAAG